MPSSIVAPMRCSKEAATAMTFIESNPSACSGQKRPAKVLHRIPAKPRKVDGVAAAGGEGFSTSGGTIHAGPSWLKMLTKEGVDSVHTLGFGFGCTGVGPGRIGENFGRVADFQEGRLVRVPPRAQCFRRSEAFVFLLLTKLDFLKVWPISTHLLAACCGRYGVPRWAGDAGTWQLSARGPLTGHRETKPVARLRTARVSSPSGTGHYRPGIWKPPASPGVSCVLRTSVAATPSWQPPQSVGASH